LSISKNKKIYTLSKEERIKSKKQIQLLFKEGRRIKSDNLHLLFLRHDHKGPVPIKMSFAVPKKKTALASNRNRLKRRMREIFRHHKSELQTAEASCFLMILIFTADEERSYKQIAQSFANLIEKFRKKMEKF